MGHRANFVVVKNNAAKAYYDQWAAMGCVYTFGEGPAAAIEALSSMESVDELLDWAFAEGGYLIDQDKHFAIVFGAPFEEDEAFDDLPDEPVRRFREVNDALAISEREYLQRIAPQWKGWKISWDSRGVDAFGNYLQDRKISGLKFQPPSYPESTPPPETIDA
jgi:hypothetical protein